MAIRRRPAADFGCVELAIPAELAVHDHLTTQEVDVADSEPGYLTPAQAEHGPEPAPSPAVVSEPSSDRRQLVSVEGGALDEIGRRDTNMPARGARDQLGRLGGLEHGAQRRVHATHRRGGKFGSPIVNQALHVGPRHRDDPLDDPGAAMAALTISGRGREDARNRTIVVGDGAVDQLLSIAERACDPQLVSLFCSSPLPKASPLTGSRARKLADARHHPAFRRLVVAVLTDLTGVNGEATRFS